MIVDSSALIAILRREAGHEALTDALAEASTRRMSAATYVESGIVADSRGPIAGRRFDEILEDLAVDVMPLTVQQASIARQAHRDFGRGSGHPAKLNFGDCFSYALATALREPLLFVGDDLTHTGVTPAV